MATAITVADPVSASDDSCTVTASERAEARRLSWMDFDQIGGSVGSFRNLVQRNCYQEAYDAYQDWLEHGAGFANARERGVGNFHMAQILGFLGKRDAALPLLRQSYRIAGPSDPGVTEWNHYVSGVIAYFEGNENALENEIMALTGIGNLRAMQWVAGLRALKRCFHRSYHDATSSGCRVN